MTNSSFRQFVMKELKGVSQRFINHFWKEALHLVMYPIKGQVSSVLPRVQSGVNATQLEWWTRYSPETGYGYEIFHGRNRDQANDESALVGKFIFIL